MRVFVRVVEATSFTAAARSLALSTAQTSRVVADLERYLCTQLLHRTTRRLVLTEAGERYLQRSRQILADVDEASSEAQGAHLKPGGRLRVHSTTSLGLHHITPLIARYTERYPEVLVELTLSQRNPDPIEDGHDVAIAFALELPDSQMVARQVGSSCSVFCASPAYLKSAGVPQVPEELRVHRYLRLMDPLYQEGWVLEGESEAHDMLPSECFRVNVAESLVKSAQVGMGICLLPAFVASPALLNGSLQRILPEIRLHERNIYALYASRRFLDAKIRTWVDFLGKELPCLLARDEEILESPDYWAGRGTIT